MTRTMPISFNGPRLSPKKMVPIATIRAVPTADQIAYAVPTAMDLRHWARSTNETTYPTTTMTDGHSREKPSLTFSAVVPSTSATMAPASRMNAIGSVSPLAAGQPHGSQAVHPLLHRPIVAAVERAVSADLGRVWSVAGFTDLTDRASHPAGIYRSPSLSVFAKLDPAGASQFAAEVRGLELLTRLSGVATPVPIAVVPVPGGAVLLTRAIAETPAAARTPDQWRSIGRVLGQVHLCHGPAFGLDFDGYFGPLRQDNRPMPSWSSFYAERRLLPCLRSAVDSGRLPPWLADGVERVAGRVPLLAGPEPRPTLLHGDAQQNNFLTASSGAVLLDACPYFGHPEVDLALLDYFEPVPGEVFDAYREVSPIDPGFWDRRELWRLFGYLAVIAVAGLTDFGRPYLGRIADAVARFR